MKVNRFNEDLAWSHSQSDQPWWETVYRQGFVDFDSMKDVRKDGWAQRGGIDRQVFLSDGTVLKVDEKVRRSSYPDFCLEYLSDEDKKTPGWIDKPLTCDFIAYAFAPSRTCYLLPFQLLRSAWTKNKELWIADYPEIRARNAGYMSVSVAVPIPKVLKAVSDAIKVSWTKDDERSLSERAQTDFFDMFNDLGLSDDTAEQAWAKVGTKYRLEDK